MNKMSTLRLLSFIVVLSLSLTGSSFAYEETFVMESFQTIEGNVTAIDTTHKRVTARWLANEILMKYQDIVLDVPDTCVITKNGETIGLQDIEANDPASIRFDSNADPLPRARSITITE